VLADDYWEVGKSDNDARLWFIVGIGLHGCYDRRRSPSAIRPPRLAQGIVGSVMCSGSFNHLVAARINETSAGICKGKKKPAISKIMKMRKGKLASNWQGGKTPLKDRIKASIEYKNWRKKVFERDNYTCWICRDKSGNGYAVILHPHHLKSFSKYIELALKINNGLTLCKFCHKTYTKYGRYQQ
jgi:hypothetical protein